MSLDRGAADPAAEAFERLRLEVALLRRAIEALGGEGDARPPDYSPTLAKLGKAVAGVEARVQALGEAPLQVLSPAQFGQLLQRATEVASAPAVAELADARAGMNDAVRRLEAVHARNEPRRRWRTALVSGLAGLVVVAVGAAALSGPIARALPVGLQAPECLAPGMLGVRRGLAGWRLPSGARPEVGRPLQLGAAIIASDPDAAAACLRRAAKAAGPVRCLFQASSLRSQNKEASARR